MLQLGAICYQMIVLNLIWLSRYIQIEVLIAQMLCEFVSFVPKKLLPETRLEHLALVTMPRR